VATAIDAAPHFCPHFNGKSIERKRKERGREREAEKERQRKERGRGRGKIGRKREGEKEREREKERGRDSVACMSKQKVVPHSVSQSACVLILYIFYRCSEEI